MDADEVPMSFQKGLTIVTVVRFLEYGGQSHKGAFFSMMPAAGGIPLNQWLEVTFTYSGFISDSYTIKVTYSLPSGTQVTHK